MEGGGSSGVCPPCPTAASWVSLGAASPSGVSMTTPAWTPLSLFRPVSKSVQSVMLRHTYPYLEQLACEKRGSERLLLPPFSKLVFFYISNLKTTYLTTSFSQPLVCIVYNLCNYSILLINYNSSSTTTKSYCRLNKIPILRK